MSKQIIARIVLLFIIAGVVFSSCAKEQSVDVDTNTTVFKEDEDGDDTKMNYEEVIEYVENVMGITIRDYLTDAEGVIQNNKWHFIKLSLDNSKKEDFISEITKICGEGVEPSTVSMPQFRNDICNELREMSVEKVYFKSNINGDTKSKNDTMIFLAKDSQNSYYLFIM